MNVTVNMKVRFYVTVNVKIRFVCWKRLYYLTSLFLFLSLSLSLSEVEVKIAFIIAQKEIM